MIALNELNSEQRAVVKRVNGPLLVLAGAGSGKTRTLTYRIAHLLDKGLASPHGILAITFTRKAAWELRRRLEELVGKASADITAVTFHSLGYKILCAESGALGFKADSLAISDASEARRLLKRAMKETGVDGTRWDVEQVAPIIDRAKDNLYGPQAFVQVKGDFFQESIAKVYTRYQQLLKENNAVDYGDLIRLSVDLLRQNEQTLAFYQQLFRYVLVDEFQDTSFGQYQLVRHLVWKHRNLCCVGSPVQAIYSWRGADIANMLHRFREDFPKAPKVVLHANYRCTKNILNTAQQVVRDLPYREELTTDNAEGDPIAVASLHTDWDEANYVAAEVQRLAQDVNYRFEDCAILFRTRAQGRLFEQVLMHRGLPYTLVGDFRFFERREIKDLLAYLRLIHDVFDAGALQRIINRPSRGLGTAALAKLQRGAPELTADILMGLHDREDLPERVKEAALRFAGLAFSEFAVAAKEKTLPNLMDYVLDRSGYLEWVKGDPEAKQRLANLAQLRVLTQRYEGVNDALALFLADIATMGDQDIGVPLEARGVTLATIHSVKGLEFPIVFMAGMEEGVFPHAKAVKTPGGIEEEQRLAYVGMTRAMTKLYFSLARTRQVGTTPIECTPSRFLAAIPRGLIERVSASVPATVRPAPCREPAPVVGGEDEFPIELEPETDSEIDSEAETARGVEVELGTASGTDVEVEAASGAEPEAEAMPAFEVEPETEFDRWLAEGQDAWNQCEVERADEIEAWVLSELEGDDTDLEAEILAGEFAIDDELEQYLQEGQAALFNYEMELAELAYEREIAASAQVSTVPERESAAGDQILASEESPGPREKSEGDDESETEDFDALLREYAQEIAAHDREKEKGEAQTTKRAEASYAIAE